MRSFIHFMRYRLGLDPAHTQTTEAERACIAALAYECQRAVEIGVFEGVTTNAIASALPAGAVLYGVDPFIAGRIGICWGKGIAKREAIRDRPACRIEFIQEFSHVASKQVDGGFDLVFIDGDHSWDGIVQDWSDWSPRVNDGGFIALHDTLVPTHNPNVASLGSHRFFIEHIQHDPRFEIVHQVDSLSVLRRVDTTDQGVTS